MAFSVNTHTKLVREAAEKLIEILKGSFELTTQWEPTESPDLQGCEFVLEAKTGNTCYRFAVETKARTTPQTALYLRYPSWKPHERFLYVVYTPFISPRVAELLRERQICFFDHAGNCWLRTEQPP